MATIADNYTQEFLDCRDVLHSWDVAGALITQPSTEKELVRHLTCSRCGGIKHQTISTKTWEITSSRYEMPIGYRLPAGTPKADIRQASFSRRLGARSVPKQRKPRQSKRVYR